MCILYSSSQETHLKATERHLSYVITVLPATRHRLTCPGLTPVRQTGTRFTYTGGMESFAVSIFQPSTLL